MDKVRAAIRQVARQRQAQSQRLGADVTQASARLPRRPGDGEAAGVTAASKARLAEELAVAANVPLVVDAVARSYRLEATRRTGWPVTRWLVRFRPDPLRRLNLRREGAKPELNRTSLPPAGAPERARTDAAVREFADAASAGAPGPWRAAIRGAAREGSEQLPDALDQAIASTELKAGGSPGGGRVFNVVQWLALLTALGGFAWLGVLAALGYLQLPVPEVPRVEGWPVPTVMIAGGVLLGIVLAVLGEVHRRRRRQGTRCRGTEAAHRRPSRPWRRNSWWSRWSLRSAGWRSFNKALQAAASRREPRAAARLACGRLNSAAASRTLIMVRRLRVVVAALYFGFEDELAERAVQGAAGGRQPGQGFRAQPGQLCPVQGAAGLKSSASTSASEPSVR